MKTIIRYFKFQFNKAELNYLSTVLGLTATIATVLTVNEVIDKRTGTVIASISAGIVSTLINQPVSVNKRITK